MAQDKSPASGGLACGYDIDLVGEIIEQRFKGFITYHDIERPCFQEEAIAGFRLHDPARESARFDDANIPTGLMEFPRDGQAADPRPDDQDVAVLVHLMIHRSGLRVRVGEISRLQ